MSGSKFALLSVLTALCTAVQLPQVGLCQQAGQGLIAYWSMDEVRDGKVLDLSGHGHDGLLKGEAGLPELVEGIIGNALRLAPARRCWVEVPASEELDPPRALTVMAWVKIAERNKPYAVICHKGDKSGPPPWPGWRLRVGWATAMVQIGTPDGNEYWAKSPRFAVQPGKWTHIAATYDGHKLRIYVNAHLEGEVDAPGGIGHRRGPLVIGNYIGRKNAYPMDGLIDEVKIFARVLNEEEILQQAAAGLREH